MLACEVLVLLLTVFSNPMVLVGYEGCFSSCFCATS